jgi:hypothetical protein
MMMKKQFINLNILTLSKNNSSSTNVKKHVSWLPPSSHSSDSTPPSLLHPTDLYNKYHENYSKPYDLPSDQVFTTISFLVKTPENKIASTELSGCIPQSEHMTAMGNPKKPSSGSGSLQKGESLEETVGKIPYGSLDSRPNHTTPKATRLSEKGTGLHV